MPPITTAALAAILLAVSTQAQSFRPEIPKFWNGHDVESFELPLAQRDRDLTPERIRRRGRFIQSPSPLPVPRLAQCVPEPQTSVTLTSCTEPVRLPPSCSS